MGKDVQEVAFGDETERETPLAFGAFGRHLQQLQLGARRVLLPLLSPCLSLKAAKAGQEDDLKAPERRREGG